MRLNDTCSMRFQQPSCAHATFSTGDEASKDNITVDVTNLVSFASSNTAVATVGTSSTNAPMLQGLPPARRRCRW